MPISASRRRNNDAYNAKCDNISIRPLKPIGADIRNAATESGQSVQGYILQAIRDRMARDGFSPAAAWPCSPSVSEAPDSMADDLLEVSEDE